MLVSIRTLYGHTQAYTKIEQDRNRIKRSSWQLVCLSMKLTDNAAYFTIRLRNI